MRKPIQRLALLLAMLCIVFAGSAHAQGASGEDLRVLFVGNSYTYGTHAPKMLELMAAARKQKIETVQQVAGGMTLERHWQGGKTKNKNADPDQTAQAKIRQGGWDFVVLQDQSMLPTMHPELTVKYGKLFCELAHEHQAQPVFFLTWAREKNPAMQAPLTKAYRQAAAAGKGTIAPVGPAFAAALTKDPKLKLHMADGSHANKTGGYLVACVWYATLTGQSPVGLPPRLIERVNRTKTLVVCALPPARARMLQEVAWEAVSQFKQPGDEDEADADEAADDRAQVQRQPGA